MIMRLKLAMSASALALLLSACGQTEAAADAAWDQGFISSCVDAAKGALGDETANTLCTCTLDKINQEMTSEQKLAMTSEQGEPMMRACLAENGMGAPGQ